VNIEGVKMKAYFEFIEITNDYDPFPTLHGIDWVFENNAVLNLKKRQILFETDTLHVIYILMNRDIYNDPVDEDGQSYVIENIYKITRTMEYYINPTVDGELRYQRMKSYDIDS
jgi:hypothetical protein